MRRLDRAGRVHFLDAAQPDTACPVERSLVLARLHACEDGQLLSGAAAFAAMWRAIPILRPLGMIARARWVETRLERLYVRFLAVRPTLQSWLR